MRGTTLAGLILLLVGLLVAPFFKVTIGGLLVYALTGGGVAILVIFVIAGVVLIALRSD